MAAGSSTLLEHGELQEVQAEIVRLMSARATQAASFGNHFARLWELASECISGGKLLRPRLLMEGFEAMSSDSAGVFHDSAVRIAAGIELLHFSFLLHDDVIDEDLTRRGRPNLIGAVLHELSSMPDLATRSHPTPAALHWARTNGILMGDMLLSATHQIFARESLPDEMRVRLLDLLDHTITESIVGEHLDVGLSDGIIAPDLGTVLTMSRLKTATYTFELPLRAAAILSGASRRTETTVGEVARHLGVAFQLQDDLLSTFGAPEEHGKDAFSDLREGKETAIIAYARMTSAWPSIEPVFGSGDLNHQQGNEIRELLTECGAERFVRSLIDEQLAACFDLVSGAQMPSQLPHLIGKIVRTIDGRRS